MKFLMCKLEQIPPSTGKKVAIIGAGPAGLGAAGYLVCQGHEVHVYDQLPEPGGLMMFAIPEYRVPKDRLRAGIEELRKAGVVFHTGTRVLACGKEKEDHIKEMLGDLLKEVVCFDKLVEEYDAVLIATGTWRSRRLNIEGEDLKGVYLATEWLVKFSLARYGYKPMSEVPPVEGNVLVIGGGLTAADAVEVPLKYLREKIKKVYLSYRRTRKEAPMGEKEFERLIKEYNVEALELTIPVKFIGDEKGHVRKVVLQRARLVEEPGKRPRPVPIPGSEFELEVDTVFIAAGELPTPPFEGSYLGIEVNPDGTIKVDNKYRTTRKGVFAAGDVVTGPSRIGPALKSGMDAARSIHEYLTTGAW